MTQQEIQKRVRLAVAEVCMTFDYAPLERERYSMSPRDAAKFTAEYARFVDRLRGVGKRERETA